MGFLDLFRNKPNTQLSKPQPPTLEQVADRIIAEKGNQIRQGLSKPTASTGTPIDALHGMAKTLAQTANIGGGSKASGGGGVEAGVDALTKFNRADAVKKTINQQKSPNGQKKATL